MSSLPRKKYPSLDPEKIIVDRILQIMLWDITAKLFYYLMLFCSFYYRHFKLALAFLSDVIIGYLVFINYKTVMASEAYSTMARIIGNWSILRKLFSFLLPRNKQFIGLEKR